MMVIAVVLKLKPLGGAWGLNPPASIVFLPEASKVFVAEPSPKALPWRLGHSLTHSVDTFGHLLSLAVFSTSEQITYPASET